MCMKDRLFRFSRMLSVTFCVLFIGGLMYSCSDDYDLPDKTPGWLGSSIYNYLKSKGNYTNTVKLIDDLDYAEVLAKTGSKTLFVANDSAYAKFYASNKWGVKSYSDLSNSQKKLLLNSAMLDNAYLLEMLPNATASSYHDGSYLDKNVCLKHATSLSATDSIAFYKWSDSAIPVTYNSTDPDYWTRFKTAAKGGIYLATDATVPLMVHWINGEMSNNKITDDDFATITGKTRASNDVYIYGSKVTKQDITCQNGYVDEVSDVMESPINMAEKIRTSGVTNIFSHMLDRFSAPFYNSSLTNAYQQLNPGVDSVFEKRYFSEWSKGATNYYAPNDVSKTKALPYLPFDPGWNTYYPLSYAESSPTRGLVADMGTIFAPSDAAMLKYFSEGNGGAFLMERYAVELPVTMENLEKNVDQIPLSVLQQLISNLMKTSFIESVPSKYLTITNDARDPMFSTVSSLNEYKSLIDTCLIGANGVVYVINKVYSPAAYACVAAPALVGDSLKIFNWAITDDDKWLNNPGNANMNFPSVYLKAMSSDLSFFIPTDNALKSYYDPVSMAYSQPYVLSFTYDGTQSAVTAKARRFDVTTGEIATTTMMKPITNSVIYNRFIDMMASHIFVHDLTVDPEYVASGREYYVSKSGAPIKVTDASLGVNGFKVQGGWQLDYNQYCKVEKIYDQTRKTNGYGNGMSYVIDRPIEATTHSVYSILNDKGAEDSPYRKFFDLCQVDEDVLKESGVADKDITQTDKQRTWQRYYIFTTANPCLDFNVRFFNTYNYTIFVPSNDAVQSAIDNGLPTWESIAAYIKEKQDDVTAHESDQAYVDSATAAYKTTSQAMITGLVNFCKYYFMDNSVFADVVAQPEKTYETACINNTTNRYVTVSVKSSGNHTLTVTDQSGTSCNVTGNINMLARDLQFDASGSSASLISTSSFAVIHQIDGLLNYKALTAGRYDSDWATPSKAKAYLTKYCIRK